MSSPISLMPTGSVLPAELLSNGDSQGRPWLSSFAVIGDFGNVSEKKNNLDFENAPANYVGEAIRRMNPDFILSLGDDNYVEGKREWKDFNVGKNYAPYIYPYTRMKANDGNQDAIEIASPSYLSERVSRKLWNRFFTAPGNHEVGMTGGKGLMEASGRRDWSHDAYYKAAFEHSRQWGSLTPLASSYVMPGDTLYYDYSYGTSWNLATLFQDKEGAMDKAYYDYLLNPIDRQGKVLSGLANIYMVDRNNTAYGDKNTAYAEWKKKNPGPVLDPQAAFMMNEAKKREKDVPWQIFASHYQTYASSGDQEGLKLPFFANGIDLVMGSHVHNYERIRAADSAGVIGDYIVNGVGGYNTAYKAGIDWGAKELFPSVGTVSGYQAGAAGKWGFGWVDMNMNELQYRQFNVDFTLVENPSLLGIQDAYWGKEPIADVKISLVDTLRLRASPAADEPLGVDKSPVGAGSGVTVATAPSSQTAGATSGDPFTSTTSDTKSAGSGVTVATAPSSQTAGATSGDPFTSTTSDTKSKASIIPASSIFGSSRGKNSYDLINWASVDFSALPVKNYKQIVWSKIDFSSITSDSLAAESLDWGQVNYKNLGRQSYAAISRSAIDLSELDKRNVLAIKQAKASEVLFDFAKVPKTGSQSYIGSDEKIDIIISGGTQRANITAVGGAGADLFIASKGKGSLFIADFEKGIDVATLALSERQLRKVNLSNNDGSAQVFYKNDLLVSFADIDASSLVLQGSQII